MSRSLSPSSSLRLRLLIPVVLAISPVVGLVLYTSTVDRQRARREAERGAEELAHRATAGQQEVFAAARQLLAVLAELPEVRDGRWDEVTKLLARFQAEGGPYGNLGVIGRDGRSVASAISLAGPIELGDRPYFLEAVRTKRSVIGEFQFGRITGRPGINVARPILDERGEVFAVLFAAIDLEWLNEVPISASMPEGTSLLALDRNGTIIVHSPGRGSVGRSMSDHPLFQAMRRGGTGTLEAKGLDGVERLYGYHGDQEGTSVLVAVGIPRDAALADANRTVGIHLVGIGLATLLALAAAWWFGGVFVHRPVRVLLEATRRMKTGDLSARSEVKEGGELGELARSFDEMAAALERRDREILDARAQYQSLVEESPGIFYITRHDERRTPIFVSSQLEAALGYAPAAWLADPGLWIRRIHDDDRERVLVALERSGRTGEPFEAEYRLLDAQGAVRWIRDTGVAVPGPGEPRLRGFLVDITASKRLEEQFLQAQKMEAVGRLAGGVAHDFNNLLTVISGYCGLLLTRLGPGEPGRREVEQIELATSRAAALTQQLLLFSRKQILRPSVLDLNRIVSGMEKMMRRLIGEDISFSTALYGEKVRIRADRGQLEQILMNLVVNARDAMPGGGRLEVSTERVRIGPDSPEELRDSLQPADYIVLSVADTGCGMDAETRRRIFEPFFTTKAESMGTGLGLSTVYGIVHAAGGCVTVESEVGRGSTFRVYLPAVDDETSDERPPPRTTPVRGGTETILVVEDEELVRDYVRAVLAGHGYRVLGAGAGLEAIELSRREKSPIDLVISDWVMPRMGGRELVEILRERRPESRFLFISGYMERDSGGSGPMPPPRSILPKPFRGEVLAAKVREVLDEKRD